MNDDPYKSIDNSYEIGLEEMIRTYAHTNSFHYDAIIAIRPDTAMLRDIDLPKVLTT